MYHASRLVRDYPDSGIAWQAVGCYYYATAQYDAARRFFGKATQLAPRHAPAWIAYGHAFAAQDESDQALAAYRTAARLFPGLHQPILGMGREYQHMNNHLLAEQMYLQVPVPPCSIHACRVRQAPTAAAVIGSVAESSGIVYRALRLRS